MNKIPLNLTFPLLIRKGTLQSANTEIFKILWWFLSSNERAHLSLSSSSSRQRISSPTLARPASSSWRASRATSSTRCPSRSSRVARACNQSSFADPWHFGVDPDPSIFITDLQDANKKLIFFHKVFLHITFCSYFYIIFQRRSHKTVKIKVFLIILALW